MLLVWAITACEIAATEGTVWVTIPPGDSIEAVAESLAAHGIVRSAEAFARFARVGRKHRGVKPGSYPLRPGTPMGKVLVLLRKGSPPVRVVRVPPGIWLAELEPQFRDVLGIGPDSLAAAAQDSSLLARLGLEQGTVEGYLFPTTYRVAVGASALEVLHQMVDTFEAHWKPEWDDWLDSLGRSRHEVVILASIIEGEGPHEEDRPIVSSVYNNRLARDRRLQADPTVVYALAERRRLYYKDYKLDSEFNTYRIRGLPPGPIGQPSTASIEAALFPEDTDFYYFVAQSDGRHIFSESYNEHLATIRRLRNRRSQ
ncbi:MAG: endolytic transglycosylase MltG [Gemmatimonadota bacterium]|nr:MAG: endolytic transglycosylase MltG [Gemmatimonadota bacterium]